MSYDKAAAGNSGNDAGTPADGKAQKHSPTEDELGTLRLWKEFLRSQDQRYGNKGLLKVVASAMGNNEFRSRLLLDPESILREVSSVYDLPEGVTLRFHENTPDTLHVVLPPLAGEQSSALRDLLRSRTSSDLHFFQDDIDLGDWTDPIPGGGTDRGDQTNRDSTDQPPIA